MTILVQLRDSSSVLHGEFVNQASRERCMSSSSWFLNLSSKPSLLRIPPLASALRNASLRALARSGTPPSSPSSSSLQVLTNPRRSFCFEQCSAQHCFAEVWPRPLRRQSPLSGGSRACPDETHRSYLLGQRTAKGTTLSSLPSLSCLRSEPAGGCRPF